MVIKKIFNQEFDEEVHNSFLKFGKGEYANRYLIEGKNQKDRYSIKTSAEFANFFVRKCLEEVDKDSKLAVKGVIISTLDLEGDNNLVIKKKSNFQGIKKLQIDSEVLASDILDLIEKYPKAFFGLTFKTLKSELKIKPKSPKSGKPGKKGEDGPKVDFCSLKTTNDVILSDLFFDIGKNWKEIKIYHTLKIEKIIYPKDLSNMKPEEVREKSKRRGVVLREIFQDGQKSEKQASFEA